MQISRRDALLATGAAAITTVPSSPAGAYGVQGWTEAALVDSSRGAVTLRQAPAVSFGLAASP